MYLSTRYAAATILLKFSDVKNGKKIQQNAILKML